MQAYEQMLCLAAHANYWQNVHNRPIRQTELRTLNAGLVSHMA